MTITYPLVAPTDVKQPSNIRLGFGNVVGVGASPYTLTAQTFDYSGDAWHLEVAFDPLSWADAAPWIAFLAALRGRKGTFVMGIKTMSALLGEGGGTPAVNGANQAGSSTLITDGWPNDTLVLKRGDIFSIDQRLYMNLTDATSDGSGNATLDVWPNVRTHADDSLLDLTDPVGTWRLSGSNVMGTEVPNTEFHNISFEAEEAPDA